MYFGLIQGYLVGDLVVIGTVHLSVGVMVILGAEILKAILDLKP